MTSVLTVWSHPFPHPIGFPSTPDGIFCSVPVPSQYYARQDPGITFRGGISANHNVTAIGDPFAFAGSPFGFNSNWLSTDFDAFFTGRAGVKA